MIKISNCPDTNLERYITAKNTFCYETTKQIILECHISHYKNGVKIENERICSYIRNLVAVDTNPVNKQTGQLVTSVIVIKIVNNVPTEVVSEELADIFKDPNVISEYQFFMNLKFVPIKQNDVELDIIDIRDFEGKFNI